jgi:hypothetical protein
MFYLPIHSLIFIILLIYSFGMWAFIHPPGLVLTTHEFCLGTKGLEDGGW